MTQKPPALRASEQQPTPGGGDLVRPVKVGRLETVNDWRRQIAKVYREMRRGELPHEQGTRLTYVAQIGAQLAKVEEELRAAREVQRRLDAILSGQPESNFTPQLLPIAGALNQESEL